MVDSNGPSDREWGEFTSDMRYVKNSMTEVLRLARANCDRIDKLESVYGLLKWIGGGLLGGIIIAVSIALVKKSLGL